MGKLTATHTYVTLEISENAYNEIAKKLREAGYGHVFNEEGEIDMHGLALVKDATPMYRCTQCGWIVDTASVPEFPDKDPRVKPND